MALIKCPECGKEFSDKAGACPNCGCPIEQAQTSEDAETDTGASLENIWSAVPEKSGRNEVIKYKATQKVGPVKIDEINRMFQINGTFQNNGKKSGIIGKSFKGLMAVSTMGMSVVAGKAIGAGVNKVGTSQWFDFADLISYELIEDDSVVTTGGVGQALAGGVIGSIVGIGGAGAIAGGITGKRMQKKRVESLYIKATLNSFKCPCILMPLITKPAKTSSKEYQNAFEEAHEILSVLDVITHNK